MRRGRKAPFSCDPNAMPEPIARLYLATPPVADAEAFAPRLAEACAAGEVVAVLLRLEAADERTLVKRVKALAPAAQEEGAAVIVAAAGEVDLAALATRGGADGVHVEAGPARRRPAFEGRRHDGGRGRGRLSPLRRAAPGRLAAAPRCRRRARRLVGRDLRDPLRRLRAVARRRAAPCRDRRRVRRHRRRGLGPSGRPGCGPRSRRPASPRSRISPTAPTSAGSISPPSARRRAGSTAIPTTPPR